MKELVRLRATLAAAFVLLAAAIPAGAGGEELAVAAEPEELSYTAAVPLESVTEEGEYVEVPLEEVDVRTREIVDLSAGYRFVDVSREGRRAAEYDRLRSSGAGRFTAGSVGRDLKLVVEGEYLNTKDYNASLLFDYKGYYRLNLRTEALYHNLDHETPHVPIATDLNPADEYGMYVRQDSVNFRYKFHDYPIHLNLGHWMLVRDGYSQLRFSDYGFDESPDPADLDANNQDRRNRLLFRTRPVKNHTQEGTIGFDAHLGPVNILYTFLIRQLDDGIAPPGFQFAPRYGENGALIRSAGLLQHNTTPESRYYSHTAKLYTSLTGGIIGSASYSYGKRDNQSSLTTVAGADQTSNTLQNVAGDFVYTPCQWFSFSVKYRHQEIDRDTPSVVQVPSLSNPLVGVRSGMDTRRDVVSANFSLRPNTILTVNGEYRGDFLQRSNTGTDVDRWRLPDTTSSNRGTMTLLYRPFKGMRLRALYAYTATDSPSYGTEAENRHEGNILASYTMAGRWGISASYKIVRENNDHITQDVTTFDDPPLHGTLTLPRDRRSVHGAASVWFAPLEPLMVSVSAGYLRDHSDQAILLSRFLLGGYAGTQYTSEAQIVSLNASYRFTERVDLSLALQQVRSLSDFKPEDTTADGISTFLIRDVSRAKTIENSLSARVNYHLSRLVSCGLDYSYRDYDNKLSSLYEGNVHQVTALVRAKW